MVGPFSPVQEQINYFFPPRTHPYETFQQCIDRHTTKTSAILDIGCGRTAPNLTKLIGKADKLYGVDLVEFDVDLHGIRLSNCSAENMTFLNDESIDLAYSRSVMEHIENVQAVYDELFRVLERGGIYVFLTPNIYDYASMIACIVPNKWHPSIVRMTEGREEHDVFPGSIVQTAAKKLCDLQPKPGLRLSKLNMLANTPVIFPLAGLCSSLAVYTRN